MCRPVSKYNNSKQDIAESDGFAVVPKEYTFSKLWMMLIKNRLPDTFTMCVYNKTFFNTNIKIALKLINYKSF